jgi:hypothetical protein
MGFAKNVTLVFWLGCSMRWFLRSIIFLLFLPLSHVKSNLLDKPTQVLNKSNACLFKFRVTLDHCLLGDELYKR